jgi:very-short-patch-repair endonuclease
MRQVLRDRPVDYVPPASNLESRVQQILRDAGVTTLRRQVDTGSDRAWIGRVDFRDERLPLVVEVQSERFHSSRISRQLDGERFAKLDQAGLTVVEVIEEDVWHRPDRVVAKVLDGLRRAHAAAA